MIKLLPSIRLDCLGRQAACSSFIFKCCKRYQHHVSKNCVNNISKASLGTPNRVRSGTTLFIEYQSMSVVRHALQSLYRSGCTRACICLHFKTAAFLGLLKGKNFCLSVTWCCHWPKVKRRLNKKKLKQFLAWSTHVDIFTKKKTQGKI